MSIEQADEHSLAFNAYVPREHAHTHAHTYTHLDISADIAAVSIEQAQQRYAEMRGYRPDAYFFVADCTRVCAWTMPP